MIILSKRIAGIDDFDIKQLIMGQSSEYTHAVLSNVIGDSDSYLKSTHTKVSEKLFHEGAKFSANKAELKALWTEEHWLNMEQMKTKQQFLDEHHRKVKLLGAQ